MNRSKRIDSIRKLWLQGKFDDAQKKFSDSDLDSPFFEIEYMLFNLFQGDFAQFEKLREDLTPYLEDIEIKLIHDILLLHRLQIESNTGDEYLDLMNQIEPKVSYLDKPTTYFWKGIYYLLAGFYQYSRQRSFDMAKESWVKVLDIAAHHSDMYSSNYLFIASHNNIGEISRMSGKLEAAIDHLEEAKHRVETTELNIALPEIYSQLGATFYELNQYEKAISHYEEGIKIPYLSQINLYRCVYFFRIFKLHQKLGNNEKLEKIHNEMSELADDNDDAIVSQTSQIMTAELLLNEKRRSKTAKAQNILEKLNDNKDLYFEFAPVVKLLYIKLLIDELANYENEELIQEINKNMSELRELAENWKSRYLEIEIMIIQSKFELVHNNIEYAFALLNTSLDKAKKIENTRIVDNIYDELSKLEDQVDKWIKLAEQQTRLEDRINEVEIHEYINEVVNRVSSH